MPAQILLIDLDAANVYIFCSEDYKDNIQTVYTGLGQSIMRDSQNLLRLMLYTTTLAWLIQLKCKIIAPSATQMEYN